MAHCSSNLDSFKSNDDVILTGHYIWTIENFTEDPGRLESPKMFIGNARTGLKGYMFGLHLFEITIENEPWYQYIVSVARVATNPLDTIVEHKFSIVDSSEKEQCVVTRRGSSNFTLGDFIGVRFIKKKTLFENKQIYFVADKTLKLRYDIKFIVLQNNGLLNDFKTLFTTQDRSDVKFLIGDKEFTAHKSIISARSIVFATMFESEMKESLENKVVIEDMDAEVFEELLRFMYTDEVEKLDVHAFELLKAAHKYEIVKLKSMCERMLMTNTNVENCAELFAASDLYSCTELKNHARNFMRNQIQDVLDTEGYKTTAKKRPDLMLEVLETLAQNSSFKRARRD